MKIKRSEKVHSLSVLICSQRTTHMFVFFLHWCQCLRYVILAWVFGIFMCFCVCFVCIINFTFALNLKQFYKKWGITVCRLCCFWMLSCLCVLSSLLQSRLNKCTMFRQKTHTHPPCSCHTFYQCCSYHVQCKAFSNLFFATIYKQTNIHFNTVLGLTFILHLLHSLVSLGHSVTSRGNAVYCPVLFVGCMKEKSLSPVIPSSLLHGQALRRRSLLVFMLSNSIPLLCQPAILPPSVFDGLVGNPVIVALILFVFGHDWMRRRPHEWDWHMNGSRRAASADDFPLLGWLPRRREEKAGRKDRGSFIGERMARREEGF